jgi:hypothetical protein
MGIGEVMLLTTSQRNSEMMGVMTTMTPGEEEICFDFLIQTREHSYTKKKSTELCFKFMSIDPL